MFVPQKLKHFVNSLKSYWKNAASVEEQNFQDLRESWHKSKFLQVLLPARISPKTENHWGLDRFIVNNLVVVNAGQTADN